MKLPALSGIIRRRILVNFRVQPAVMPLDEPLLAPEAELEAPAPAPCVARNVRSFVENSPNGRTFVGAAIVCGWFRWA